MKKILITGKKGYIANELRVFLEKKGEIVDNKSVRNNELNNINFNEYKLIIHTAGLVHKNEKKVTNKNEYFEINTFLTEKIALKAKTEGVEHFIFLSTMSVFGIQNGVIDQNTIPNPTSYYGKSKLLAEEKIIRLEDTDFKVSVIRPPMVYGNNCPGNYNLISTLSKKNMFFPDLSNKRSMIYIENLSNFIYLLYINKRRGTFHPQNEKYTNTYEMYSLIRKHSYKKTIKIKKLNPLITYLINHNGLFQKIFGDLIYDQNLSTYEFKYELVNFKKSIELSEGEENVR